MDMKNILDLLVNIFLFRTYPVALCAKQKNSGFYKRFQEYSSQQGNENISSLLPTPYSLLPIRRN
jgi:hypothetical protein